MILSCRSERLIQWSKQNNLILFYWNQKANKIFLIIFKYKHVTSRHKWMVETLWKYKYINTLSVWNLMFFGVFLAFSCIFRRYITGILRRYVIVYISKHIVCSHILLQFTRNNALQLADFDRNFKNMSETFLAETFSAETFHD